MEPSGFTVRVAAPVERQAALELALRPLAIENRGPLLDALRALPATGLGALDALVVAVRSGVEAAAWAQPTPGRGAAFWAPEWRGSPPPEARAVETRLAAVAMRIADQSGVAVSQCLFENPVDLRREAIENAGFRRIATLEYLGTTVRGVRRHHAEGGGLEFRVIESRDYGRLKRLLERTYIDSLDCPAMGDVRDLDDVVAGYRATGRHDPSGWRFAVEGGVEVGVVLVADHPDADQAELVYMGLTPEARGQGFGRGLIAEALAIAAEFGADQLMTAVDTANTPARKLYGRAGFAAWATREVFTRPRYSGE